MKRIIIRAIYIILFAVLVCFNIHKEDSGISIDIAPLGTYATLFLSVLLIDVTYNIGKRQNEISKRQNEIAEQQTEIQKRQYQIEKFNHYRNLHRSLYQLQFICVSFLPQIYDYIVSKSNNNSQINDLKELRQSIIVIRTDIQNGISDAKLRQEKQIDIEPVFNFVIILEFILILVEKVIPPVSPVIPQIESFNIVINKSMYEQAEIINNAVKDIHLQDSIIKFVERYKSIFEGENNILAQLQRLYNE